MIYEIRKNHIRNVLRKGLLKRCELLDLINRICHSLMKKTGDPKADKVYRQIAKSISESLIGWEDKIGEVRDDEPWSDHGLLKGEWKLQKESFRKQRVYAVDYAIGSTNLFSHDELLGLIEIVYHRVRKRTPYAQADRAYRRVIKPIWECLKVWRDKNTRLIHKALSELDK